MQRKVKDVFFSAALKYPDFDQSLGFNMPQAKLYYEAADERIQPKPQRRKKKKTHPLPFPPPS
jgi:hypothetical protein